MLGLVAATILIRIPFLESFDLVTYDGTFYINIARSILAGSYRSSVFPIGYPALIAAFIPLIGDGVRAAQAVSVLAGIGSVLIFYVLCRRFAGRSRAFLAGLIFAVTPLFIRLSTTTLSESTYVFWVLLGLLFFARKKELPAGLGLGMAAITRPEAIGIIGVLCILRLKMPKRLFVLLAGFIIPYSVNVTVQSIAADQLVLIPKTKLFGTSATSWRLQEQTLEFASKERLQDKISQEMPDRNVISDYIGRFPQDLWMLAKHATPFIVLLAFYAFFKRRSFVLAMFAPLPLFPFFTFRGEPRFIYPFIPGILLYAIIALESVQKRMIRIALTVALCVSAAAGIAANRDQLIQPVSDGFQWAKQVGRTIRGRVSPGDRIADRKPLFAFYAGGEYFEIPIAPIDKTLAYLASNNVEYLVLHGKTIQMMRPQLLPMIHDPMFVRSELRYSRIVSRQDVIVCRKQRNSDPLTRRRLTPPSEDVLFGPCWSPDGTLIAVRTISTSGASSIRLISTLDGHTERILTATALDDPIAWSPGSDRIAFARSDTTGMNVDIFAYHCNGTLERITTHMALDISPCWSADGSEIIFSSNRSGQDEICSVKIETGTLEQITDGWHGSYPAISPDGETIAWIREGKGLYLLDRGTGEISRAAAPRMVNFAPSWSHDGRFIAVTGSDWGKMDVYIVTADGRDAVLLTKTTRREGQPGWAPGDTALVTATMRGENMQLWICAGLEPYKDRLTDLSADTRR